MGLELEAEGVSCSKGFLTSIEIVAIYCMNMKCPGDLSKDRNPIALYNYQAMVSSLAI